MTPRKAGAARTASGGLVLDLGTPEKLQRFEEILTESIERNLEKRLRPLLEELAAARSLASSGRPSRRKRQPTVVDIHDGAMRVAARLIREPPNGRGA